MYPVTKRSVTAAQSSATNVARHIVLNVLNLAIAAARICVRSARATWTSVPVAIGSWTPAQ